MSPQIIFPASNPVTNVGVVSPISLGWRRMDWTQFTFLNHFHDAISRVSAVTSSLRLGWPSLALRPHVATRTISYLNPTTALAAPGYSNVNLFLVLLIIACLSGATLVHFRLRRASPQIDSDDLVPSKSFYSESPTLINLDIPGDGASFPSAHINLLGIYLLFAFFRILATVFRLLHVAQVVDFIERNDGGQEATVDRKPVKVKPPKDEASIRKPLTPLTPNNGAIPSPVEPSGVPGKGGASSESPYLAELKRIFETPLDVPLQLRKPPGYNTPIADSPCQGRVRKIFERVIDEIDKPRDPLLKAEVHNTARCPTNNDVDKPLSLVPQARVSIFHCLVDEPCDPAPKASESRRDERKTPLERARARVEQITRNTRLDAGLRASSKGFEDEKLLSARVIPNVDVPQTGADNPANTDVPRESVHSGPASKIASSEFQSQSKSQGAGGRTSRPCGDSHDHASSTTTSQLFSRSSGPSNSTRATSCPITTPEEAGQRAARISQLHDMLERPPAKLPPVCAQSREDAITAKRNKIVDEVERLFMEARTYSKTTRSQRDSPHTDTAKRQVLLEPALPIVSDFVYKMRTASLPCARSAPLQCLSKVNPAAVSNGESSCSTPEHPGLIEDIFFNPPNTPCKRKKVKTIRDLSFDDSFTDIIPGFGVGSPASRRKQQLDDQDYFITSTPRVNHAHIRGFCTSTPRKGYNNRRDTWASFF